MERTIRVVVAVAMLLGAVAWAPPSEARATPTQAGLTTDPQGAALCSATDALRSVTPLPQRQTAIGALVLVRSDASRAAVAGATRMAVARRPPVFRRKCPPHRVRRDASDVPS